MDPPKKQHTIPADVLPNDSEDLLITTVLKTKKGRVCRRPSWAPKTQPDGHYPRKGRPYSLLITLIG